MPSGDWLKEQGRVMSERIHALLYSAGSDGLSVQQAAEVIGCKVHLIWQHLSKAGTAVLAKTRDTKRARWFCHEADALAYVERVNGTNLDKKHKPKRHTFGAGRLEEVKQLLKDAGVNGLSRHQAAEQLKTIPNTAGKILTELTRHGIAKHRKIGSAGIRLYFLAEHFQPKLQKVAKPPKPPKPAKQAKKIKLAAPMKPAAVKVAPPASREPIFTPATKYTSAPTRPGRFHVDEAAPFFAAMTPGSYLKTGSAIERAYS